MTLKPKRSGVAFVDFSATEVNESYNTAHHQVPLQKFYNLTKNYKLSNRSSLENHRFLINFQEQHSQWRIQNNSCRLKCF